VFQADHSPGHPPLAAQSGFPLHFRFDLVNHSTAAYSSSSSSRNVHAIPDFFFGGGGGGGTGTCLSRSFRLRVGSRAVLCLCAPSFRFELGFQLGFAFGFASSIDRSSRRWRCRWRLAFRNRRNRGFG